MGLKAYETTEGKAYKLTRNSVIILDTGVRKIQFQFNGINICRTFFNRLTGCHKSNHVWGKDMGTCADDSSCGNVVVVVIK